MPMPRSTGLPSADAQSDFARARRRNSLRGVTAFLRREPDDVNLILPFDEVVQALGMIGRRSCGISIVELDTIVGTVDRLRSFDRGFRPMSAEVQARWQRIAEARRRGDSMPPIDLYRIGEAHFVRDGHHRVSVAIAQGDEVIEANVTEILTRVGMDRSIRISDLPVKSQERLFQERVPLEPHQLARIQPTEPAQWGTLAEGVEAWGYRLMQRDGVWLDRRTLAQRWFHEEYTAALDVLRDAGLLEETGAKTETEAYIRLTWQRWQALQTQEWNTEVIETVRRTT
jgi:hypothetical protein